MIPQTDVLRDISQGRNPVFAISGFLRLNSKILSILTTEELQEEIIKKADLILVMTNEHKEYIYKEFHIAQNKTFLLKKFTLSNKSESNQNNERNYEIIDPIGRKIEFYRIVARELKKNLEKILDKILEENNK